ncbi:hypothetical protein EVAR_5393_1 [Eumeta japonica]|uniref:Uncharacterized protein n=1 Tax=Eumeta variegata TaxID=151549 RepID=A0A4C2ACK0_EUMVA|nr:hypothetical protein EVAR_5393_1 [Eumeta japonica]
MRWFLDRGCPFHPILETSHSGKSRNGKERNSPFCVMSSLSAATVVSSTTAGEELIREENLEEYWALKGAVNLPSALSTFIGTDVHGTMHIHCMVLINCTSSVDVGRAEIDLDHEPIDQCILAVKLNHSFRASGSTLPVVNVFTT